MIIASSDELITIPKKTAYNGEKSQSNRFNGDAIIEQNINYHYKESILTHLAFPKENKTYSGINITKQ